VSVRGAAPRHGWYQVAFERELTGAVSPVSVGTTALVVVRTPHGVRVGDAACPHRGAHLGHGGRLEAGVLVCPFHGLRIALGEPSDESLCVREYHALSVDGLVFVRVSDALDNGFGKVMENLQATHRLVPGFAMTVRAPGELVIENAFDQGHFGPVHGIGIARAFELGPSHHGELAVEGVFQLPASRWQRGRPGRELADVPFRARAFSPGIVVSELGGEYPYTVLTAATPADDGGSVIRVSLALPPDAGSEPPRRELQEYLLRRSRDGLEKDRIVWEHLSAASDAPEARLDTPVREFRAFCRRFTTADGA
jgi:nitrite reductase/ring-hydroxylating ferredoxin subunit